MIINILKCSIMGGWYRNKIRQNIHVEFVDREGYWAREGGYFNAINKINKGDANLIWGGLN